MSVGAPEGALAANFFEEICKILRRILSVPKDQPLDEITPEILLRAYAMGIFPMAEARDDHSIHWVDPRKRGILPLDGFHISRSLARRLKSPDITVTTDQAFAEVVSACADRGETWISQRIQGLYQVLHNEGHAHSLEVWQDDQLAGGVYGVVLGAAFFGESMFSRQTDASKVALAHLVHRLRAGGFTLFDTQFLTPHLATLGGIEIPRAEYHRRLAKAQSLSGSFNPPGYSSMGVGGASGSMQDSSQTS
jgi:leucyl/phenylalanyl-tRNA---protein transferase